MTRVTIAIKWWFVRHNLSHLYYACKYGQWKAVWSTLSKPIWPRVIDFKAVDPGPDDLRGIPYKGD